MRKQLTNRSINQMSIGCCLSKWKLLPILCLLLGIGYFRVNAQTCTIANQTISTTSTTLGCGSTNSNITLGSTELGVTYLLKNTSTNSILDNQEGTGASLNFPTGKLLKTTTYSVVGAKKDSGLSFDGIDDYVSSTVQFNYGAGSWEAWIKKDNWANHHNDILFANGIGTSFNGSFYISLHPAGFHFRYGGTAQNGNGYVLTPLTQFFSPGSWHHLAATWHSSGSFTVLTLYADGEEIISTSVSLLLNGTSTQTYIGGGGDHTDYFGSGTMNDVRIWSNERTSTQIQTSLYDCLVGNENNLLANWKMIDGSGNTIKESSAGNTAGSFDGTLVNFTTPSCWTSGNMYCTCKRIMSQTATVQVKPKPSSAKVASFTTTRCGGGTAILHPVSGGPSYAWVFNGGDDISQGCSGFPVGMGNGSKGNTGSGNVVKISGSGSGSSAVSGPFITKGDFTTAVLGIDSAFSFSLFAVDSINGIPCLSDTSMSFCILVASECITKAISPTINTTLQLFPNPSNGEVEVSFELATASDVSMKIYNQSGQIVFVDSRQRLDGKYSARLDLHALQKGLYFLSILTEEGAVGRSLLIE